MEHGSVKPWYYPKKLYQDALLDTAHFIQESKGRGRASEGRIYLFNISEQYPRTYY
jgi:hypothetical protein